MKKAISLLLALVLCLSLCACGSGNDTPETTVNKDSFNTPADTTETTAPLESTESEPNLITVTITADNWDEYFEIIEYRYYNTNEFDEFAYVGIEYLVKLKDQYIAIEGVPDINQKRLIEYSYSSQKFVVEIDHNNKTFSLVEESPESKKIDTTNTAYVWLWNSHNCQYSKNDGTYDVYPLKTNTDWEGTDGLHRIYVYSDLKVLNVEEFTMTIEVVSD